MYIHKSSTIIMTKLVFQELVWRIVGVGGEKGLWGRGLGFLEDSESEGNQGITVHSQQSRKQVVGELKGNRMETCWERTCRGRKPLLSSAEPHCTVQLSCS